MRRWDVLVVMGILLATGARGAISVTATSDLTTSVVGPPVKLEIGPSGTKARYFSSLALTTNETGVSGTIIGRAGADGYMKEALRLVNQRASAQSVTLVASQITNAQVEAARWRVYDGGTLVATLDMKLASPSASFSMPASATRQLDLRLDLADGTGMHNAPTSLPFTLRVAIGGIQVEHTTSAPSLDVQAVIAPLGKLVADSSVGANSTNATGSAAAFTVVQGTRDYFYLNNTDATAPSFAKLVHFASSGIEELTTGRVGIDNGTSSVDHIRISVGSLEQSGGSYLRLEPGSSNKVYVTSLEGALFTTANIDFDVYVSDEVSGNSYHLSKARVTLT